MPQNETNRNIIERLPARVYFVESEQDNTVHYALDVEIRQGYATWFDGTKERIMRIGSIIEKKSDLFVFERDASEGGGQYRFVPMTLELYNSKVKQHLISPSEFQNEEEMFKAFEETKKSAW